MFQLRGSIDVLRGLVLERHARTDRSPLIRTYMLNKTVENENCIVEPRFEPGLKRNPGLEESQSREKLGSCAGANFACLCVNRAFLELIMHRPPSAIPRGSELQLQISVPFRHEQALPTSLPSKHEGRRGRAHPHQSKSIDGSVSSPEQFALVPTQALMARGDAGRPPKFTCKARLAANLRKRKQGTSPDHHGPSLFATTFSAQGLSVGPLRSPPDSHRATLASRWFPGTVLSSCRG